MDSISFNSKIRIVNKNDFDKITSNIGVSRFVDYPWTTNESIMSNIVYTKNISNCVVCGIKDGSKVLLLHICPTIFANHDFADIEDYIRSKIDLKKKGLHGFILGSKTDLYDNRSNTLFDNFVKFMKKNLITYSFFKGGPHEHHVAYYGNTDEWIIGSVMSASQKMKEVLKEPINFYKQLFDKIEVSKLDELTW